MSLARDAGGRKALCRGERGKPQFSPSCLKPEAVPAAARGAVAILTW